MVSPQAMAKWCMLGSRNAKLPAMNAFIFVGVEFIAHADFERSGDDRDVFAVRVPMGRDAEAIRHLQANREVAGGGARVAFEYGKLRAGTYDWRRRAPGNGVRREWVLLVRIIVRGDGEKPVPRHEEFQPLQE